MSFFRCGWLNTANGTSTAIKNKRFLLLRRPESSCVQADPYPVQEDSVNAPEKRRQRSEEQY